MRRLRSGSPKAAATSMAGSGALVTMLMTTLPVRRHCVTTIGSVSTASTTLSSTNARFGSEEVGPEEVPGAAAAAAAGVVVVVAAGAEGARPGEVACWVDRPVLARR
eukprot:m.431724 g.431724  ORF g.431724 m.431724 type:complete len:107 (+) comp20243_c11_seq2:4501-4821(+)